ncbi:MULTISPECIES: hypothetical protein [unclassified Mesorhizobium]|uniref:hypothetical protein n=1 Tax=unclassified Mesorhizobium TaxID=325217 RepID=UPI000FD5CD8A|nr:MULTISPECIES: hypothetical protein [unclassified Mesorhizobium]RVB79126.1 hypothetical protein EN885_07775 [Mesorhizobium sp. M6A.T.Cr.TU.014.01.1.1]RWP82370.1 MAG: hypothetical protein EOR10_03470 [Mesorhizobium sp.]RWQ10076.1 MAG: hypothetical protein EOR90_06540 [Mesorhizobium sp.]RWQ11214.1 MAG: hypothetical protein EOR91_03340 [Mesorhizobium sp.]
MAAQVIWLKISKIVLSVLDQKGGTVSSSRFCEMFENNMWLIVVAGGPLLLAILIAYALITRRDRGPAERRESDRATERLYREQRD